MTGHTDATGSSNHNQQLSERRAASVGEYLVAQGVQPARVVTKGFGSRLPIANNESSMGRQANRRVELRLIPLTS